MALATTSEPRKCWPPFARSAPIDKLVIGRPMAGESTATSCALAALAPAPIYDLKRGGQSFSKFLAHYLSRADERSAGRQRAGAKQKILSRASGRHFYQYRLSAVGASAVTRRSRSADVGASRATMRRDYIAALISYHATGRISGATSAYRRAPIGRAGGVAL